MDKKRGTSHKKAKKKSYEHIGPGYVFVSKAHYSEMGMGGEFVKCDIGDLCIVIERRLNNSVYHKDPFEKYTFVIQNLDRKLTFLVDRGFPYHIPINSPIAAALYC